MEDSDIVLLNTGTVNEASKILNDFYDKNLQTFSFVDLNKEDKRKRLWEAVFCRLNDPQSQNCYFDGLSVIRLLSRDKTCLNDLIQEKWIARLLNLSGITAAPIDENSQVNDKVMLEAQKCLSNLIFNSECAQAWCSNSKSACLSGLIQRLRSHPQLSYDICLFDFKILFLVTALCNETRTRVCEELKGITHLTESLERLVPKSNASETAENVLSEKQAALVSEVLKTLFNIVKGAKDKPADEEEEAQFRRLIPILCVLMRVRSAKQDELRRHCVHILMAVPAACYTELIPILSNGQEMEYQGRDMEMLDIMLDMLEERLKNLTPEASTSQEAMEQLCPLLTVLGTGSLEHRPIRKYVRMRVLPPLKEVHKRPEEADSIRGLLCKLLTCPVSPLRDLAADLLFILCKESVVRMVKYTGYGNCAGLLANRGLMLGGRGDRGHYSSESEDSDTEEYKEHRDQINPVIGCCEPPRPNPMANMSDEQKEHEAMQIVNMLDKLTRSGVVLPGRIGEDGKPEPLEHVLQLQECLTCPPNNLGGDQSDSE